ncbi:MAG: metallophosphoesterase [Lachnospiraceae bacterium]|nr:metallophosphoesterase [Lachnospiraceae bacterium]
MRSHRKVRLISAFILIILLASIWSWIPVTERININISSGENFGIRIALITDLHSCYYGKDQKRLINRIDNESPDLIILSGDIFDDKLSDDNAKILLEDLVTKYPCYYVTGNHEYWSGRAESMKEYLKGIGVHVLAGECETIEYIDHVLDICGVDDPTYMTDSSWKEQIERAYSETNPDHIRILLSHRPEKVSVYENYDFDLILCGHAHAGQFRIPIINKGIFAPDQGFMAEYVNGIYELSNGSKMIVSRGLARESTPLPRYFNRPELVIINI